MRQRAPVIVGVIFFLVALLAFFFVVRPKMKEVDVAQQDLETAQQEEQTLKAELERLRQVEREAPQIREELAVLRKELPPVADLPGLINLLQSAADRAGVDFFAVSPGDPEVVEGVPAAQIPAQIQVVGGFFQVDEFLFRVESLRRAAKVVNVSVSESADGLPEISVTIDARFYTTDVDAGPGSSAAVAPAPETSPSPGASPGPGTSPTPGTTPGTIESPEV